MNSHTVEHHCDNKKIYDMLKYLSENDKLDMRQIQNVYDMTKKQELLNRHIYAIYQGKDGKWYTYLPDGEGKRKKIKRTTKQSLEQVVIDYWQEKEYNPSIEEVFTEWNNWRLEVGKIQPSTYSRNERLFKRHFQNVAKEGIKDFSPERMELYLEGQISEHSLTSKAFANLKTVTKGFMKYARKHQLVTYNIQNVFDEMELTEREFRKVYKEDYQEVFSEKELPLIMGYLQEHLDLRNLGIMIMLVTGIRVGELVTLKHDDFDGNTFRIRRTETRYKDLETGKDIYAIKDFPKTEAGMRTAIIPRDYQWILQKIKVQNPFGEFVFVENGKQLTTNCIRQRMYRVCKKLNIYPKSPHKARKTYGSILIDNNIDARLITSMMGHTDILTTEQHYHRNRKSIDRKIEILSNIPEFKAN